MTKKFKSQTVFSIAEVHRKRGPVPGKKYGPKKMRMQKLYDMQSPATSSGNNALNGIVGSSTMENLTSANASFMEGSDNCGLTSRSMNVSPVLGGSANKSEK